MSKNNPHGLKVGQEVWIAPGSLHNLRSVKIVSIGREYAQTRNGRIHMALMKYGDGQKPDRLYDVWLSRNEYDDKKELDKAWLDFSLLVRNIWKVPDHLSLEMIQELTKKVRGE